MGKGSSPRPYSVSQKTFASNYDAIFRKNDITSSVDNSYGNCGCGRSPTGKCIGWHGLTEQDYLEKLREYDLEQHRLQAIDQFFQDGSGTGEKLK